MQALRDEMALRDETRELDAAEEELDHKEFVAKAEALSLEQKRIAALTAEAINDIFDLPNGSQRFAKEERLLQQVVVVMNEARVILRRPDAGPDAVAAETEAIELLLGDQAEKSKWWWWRWKSAGWRWNCCLRVFGGTHGHRPRK